MWCSAQLIAPRLPPCLDLFCALAQQSGSRIHPAPAFSPFRHVKDANALVAVPDGARGELDFEGMCPADLLQGVLHIFSPLVLCFPPPVDDGYDGITPLQAGDEHLAVVNGDVELPQDGLRLLQCFAGCLVFRPPFNDKGWPPGGIRIRRAPRCGGRPLELPFQKPQAVLELGLGVTSGLQVPRLRFLFLLHVLDGFRLLLVVGRDDGEHLVGPLHLAGDPRPQCCPLACQRVLPLPPLRQYHDLSLVNLYDPRTFGWIAPGTKFNL